jgi:hypothetical protein
MSRKFWFIRSYYVMSCSFVNLPVFQFSNQMILTSKVQILNYISQLLACRCLITFMIDCLCHPENVSLKNVSFIQLQVSSPSRSVETLGSGCRYSHDARVVKTVLPNLMRFTFFSPGHGNVWFRGAINSMGGLCKSWSTVLCSRPNSSVISLLLHPTFFWFLAIYVFP